MDAAVKGLLYLGVVLLVGAGLFERFVGPGLAGTGRPVLVGTWVGAGLVGVGSALNIVTTLVGVLGVFDGGFFWDYVQTTQHGRATILRLVLVAVLLGLTWMYRTGNKTWTNKLPHRLSTAVFLVTGLGLLLTFSFISHNAAMGGTLPLLADLGHFVGACLWAGAVLYTAFAPRWRDPAARPGLTLAVARVSSLGLASVALLVVTGIYASLLHIGQPSVLVETVYGRVLVVKVVLVLVILSIAAANRWYFLPALKKPHRAAALCGRCGSRPSFSSRFSARPVCSPRAPCRTDVEVSKTGTFATFEKTFGRYTCKLRWPTSQSTPKRPGR